MPNTPSQKMPSGAGQAFWRTAWPEIGAEASESQRRRKLAVRAGHGAMVFLLLAAVGSTPLVFPQDYSRLDLAVLLAATLAYAVWNVVGSTGIVTIVLWEGKEAPPLSLRRPRGGALLFFSVQIGLATLIYGLSERGRMPDLSWLLLLPPVAYAVFILEWRGIAVISTLMLAAMVLILSRWHGLAAGLLGGLAFLFAVVFTLVFSMLAVQSEKARNEVQRLAAELADANLRLRQHAVQAEELSATRERNRIAREIHDSLGHFLTVANMQLQAAKALGPLDPARAQAATAQAEAFIQEGLRDIRQSVTSLRSSPLDNKPLAQALGELVAVSSSEKPAAEFSVLGAPRPLPAAVELSLYRAAQEGLTNARKHAQASQISVRLDYQAAHGVALSVQDDGVGARAAGEARGFGLRGLQERAQLLGGVLETRSTPPAGFLLKFEVPA